MRRFGHQFKAAPYFTTSTGHGASREVTRRNPTIVQNPSGFEEGPLSFFYLLRRIWWIVADRWTPGSTTAFFRRIANDRQSDMFCLNQNYL